jgi:hypothetical protein
MWRRIAGTVLALMAVGLVATGALSPAWWHGSPREQGVVVQSRIAKIGLLGGEGCFTKGTGGCRSWTHFERSDDIPFGAAGAGAFAAGVVGAALLVVLVLVGLVRSGSRASGRLGLVAGLCFVAAGGAAGAFFGLLPSRAIMPIGHGGMYFLAGAGAGVLAAILLGWRTGARAVTTPEVRTAAARRRVAEVPAAAPAERPSKRPKEKVEKVVPRPEPIGRTSQPHLEPLRASVRDVPARPSVRDMPAPSSVAVPPPSASSSRLPAVAPARAPEPRPDPWRSPARPSEPPRAQGSPVPAPVTLPLATALVPPREPAPPPPRRPPPPSIPPPSAPPAAVRAPIPLRFDLPTPPPETFDLTPGPEVVAAVEVRREPPLRAEPLLPLPSEFPPRVEPLLPLPSEFPPRVEPRRAEAPPPRAESSPSTIEPVFGLRTDPVLPSGMTDFAEPGTPVERTHEDPPARLPREPTLSEPTQPESSPFAIVDAPAVLPASVSAAFAALDKRMPAPTRPPPLGGPSPFPPPSPPPRPFPSTSPSMGPPPPPPPRPAAPRAAPLSVPPPSPPPRPAPPTAPPRAARPSAPVPSTAPADLPPPAPGLVASGPVPACPHCESPTLWVDEHLRFYCRTCRLYL